MSYVRFGWGPNDEYPGTPEAKAAGASDIYMFGTDGSDGGPVIECCDCLLSDSNMRFVHLDALREHLDAHRNAGHVVHDFVQPAIEAEFEPNGRMAP